jgi:hypothetical protein
MLDVFLMLLVRVLGAVCAVQRGSTVPPAVREGLETIKHCGKGGLIFFGLA